MRFISQWYGGSLLTTRGRHYRWSSPSLFFSPLRSRINVEQSTRAALDKLYHRGPDGEGIYRAVVEGGALTLAHRRLAIIGLSDSGLQPSRVLLS